MTAGVYDGDLLIVATLDTVDPWWKSCVRQAVDVLRREGKEFTSDDVFSDRFHERFGITQPTNRAEKNHVGAIFAALSRAGLIREVGRRTSTRPPANFRKVSVWIGVLA